MTRRLVLTFALMSAASLCACGSSATCADGEVSLRITAPEEGDTVTTDSVMIDVEACGLELGESIRIQLLSPVEADYGFIRYEGRPLLGLEVPTLPGEMTFVVTNMDGSLPSQQVTITVEMDE